MINGENFFDQPIKNKKVTYENIRKIATGQGNDDTTGFLLNYQYIKDYYKVIAVDLSKQQALDADPRAIQQINLTENLDRARIYFILEEAKETILDFSQGTVKNGAYVNNLDQYHDIGTNWVTLYVNNKTVTYFDFFGVEHIPKEIEKFIGNKILITNIFRIQAYASVMCGYFCIGFIDFMFNG